MEAEYDDSLFDCPVCLCVLDASPRQLQPCGHVVCSGCLSALRLQQSFTCPLCSASIRGAEPSTEARDMVAAMAAGEARCSCGVTVSVLSLRSHWVEVHGAGGFDEINLAAQNRVAAENNNSSASVSEASAAAVATRRARQYNCPLCATADGGGAGTGLSRQELFVHCQQHHGGRSGPACCPVCAAEPWGDPNYVSRNFAGHCVLRHSFDPDIFQSEAAEEEGEEG